MSKARILHLIHHLNIGGAEVLLADLLPILAGRGFDVTVGCLTVGGPLCERLRERGVRVLVLNKKRGADFGAVLRLAGLLRDLRIRILNTHQYSAYLWGGIAASLARTPFLVATMHGEAGWAAPLKHSMIIRLLRRRTDRYVAVSEAAGRSLTREYRIPQSAISVVWNGIDAGRFRRTDGVDAHALRASHGVPPELPVVGMIGRCVAEKGGDTLIRAVADLINGGAAIHAVLLGEGPARAEWEALAARMGIEEHITFAGADLRVPEWMRVFSVVACPSREEGFGIAAVEAQAAGLPVVASSVGGLPEVLGSGAILVPPDQPEQLAAAIREVLSDHGLRNRLVEAGIRNAEERFSISHTADGYAAMYEELLNPLSEPRQTIP